MSSTGRGLPLLSGPPPQPSHAGNESSCRKCDKEFNILFTRSKRCNHCGYLYCSSCSDFQALMPRGGSETGYDVMPVCAFCIENLNITASGKGQLKQQPLTRLRQYAHAYNIKINGILEKDELIDKLISARGLNGCLLPDNEEFYRKNSVPNRSSSHPRGIFTRAMDAVGSERNSPGQQPQPQSGTPPQRPAPYQARARRNSGPNSFPRPDLDPRRQQQGPSSYRSYAPPPRVPRAQHLPPQYPPHYAHTHSQPYSNSPNLNVPNPNTFRPRAASASSPPTPRHRSPPARAPSPSVPSLDELLDMTEERLSALSIGQLKAVLRQNHVNARLVVEKGDLVSKVRTLVEDERGERERKLREEEAERAAEMGWETPRTEEELGQIEAEAIEDALGESGLEHEEQHSETMDVDDNHESVQDETPVPPEPARPATAPAPTRLSPKAQAMASHLERTGLCVICQDEEANIAIVDCGHLALCRACSEMVMNSTRECPLCRTRIVTDARLLRIYRT